MADPYKILDLPPDCDDEMIRRRYLELVRQHSPEKSPEKFSEIREAYEQLKDLDTRLRFRLFQAGQNENIESIVEEIQCQSSRRRHSLSTLVKTARLC